MTEEEIWCPVKNYESLYEVSDQGRVKSLKFGKERILKPLRNLKGYLLVNLYKNGERKTYRVHRLVAKTFTPNPHNLPEVNHKDENKENNSVQNLEWCDSKYNNNYGTRNQRSAKARMNNNLSKPILQFTNDGEFVREWKSTVDVQRNLGYAHQNISSCCTGKIKSSYGYIWKFKD